MVCAKRLLNVVVMMILALTLKANADEVCLRAAMVSGGEVHTLVLMENGSLWACGGDGLGQLGNGTDGSSNVLIPVHDGDMNTASGFLENIIAADAGWKHSLALDNSGGYVYAWGYDSEGQLGNGTLLGNQDVPGRVRVGEQNPGNPTAPLSNITCISAGRSGLHSLASQGQFTYAWGYNYWGQCGNGEIHNQIDTPVKVKRSLSPVIYLGDGADADIVEVDAGVYHSLARDTAGYVWEWGRGNPLAHKVPGETGVGYLANIIEIASCYQSLALSSGGNVYQWETGYPVKVPGGQMGTTYLENIVSIGAGTGHYLALDSNGFVW
jgi:alpha-tubulin suppressor-like RCC1 family protein